MIRNFFSLFLMGLVVTGLGLPSFAQGQDTPVAVVSLVWGAVTVKHQDADYKPARWLEPIFPGDQVRTTGPGSKLLVTYFFDKHQEVVGPDLVADAQAKTLTKTEGKSDIRRDAARQPFGAGGVESPFVYTHKLVQDDFAGADAPGAMEKELATLKSRVRPTFPPSFWWQTNGASEYEISIAQPGVEGGGWTKKVTGNQYKLTLDEANSLLKGVNYDWTVKGNGETVVASYPFKLLTLPLKKWYNEQVGAFNDSRNLDKLQRNQWTDYLLVCAQVNEVDRSMEIIEKMRQLDPKNPRIYRALTRIYILKGCPAHAKSAHDQLVALGGRDPIYP